MNTLRFGIRTLSSDPVGDLALKPAATKYLIQIRAGIMNTFLQMELMFYILRATISKNICSCWLYIGYVPMIVTHIAKYQLVFVLVLWLMDVSITDKVSKLFIIYLVAFLRSSINSRLFKIQTAIATKVTRGSIDSVVWVLLCSCSVSFLSG